MAAVRDIEIIQALVILGTLVGRKLARLHGAVLIHFENFTFTQEGEKR